ncbi:1-pyrroline-5-carboxylate dehydrogenase [Burkholderia pyrrocinia]|nr:1-pyrroline-5-carboxylate dehydrogenase [Burkholderia pyrrocinia]
MREDIGRYLGMVSDATAKSIASGTGLPQLDVTKELNRMLGSGIVEREKRAGSGNEYVYWLSRGDAPAPPASPRIAPEADKPTEPPAISLTSIGLVERSIDPNACVIDPVSIIANLRTDIERLTVERDAARQTADTWRANAATLEARIDELTLGPVGAGAPMFVTVGRNSKPQRHDSLEKAQKRVRSLVRSEKESEVLVLEPVGRIVRGTEWRPR